LLQSRALGRVLAEYGKPDKIRRFEEDRVCTVRAALFARGLVFGRLRWLAQRHGCGLPSGALSPERFTDRNPWEVDRDRLYALAVIAGVSPSIHAVHGATSGLPEADPWSICQDHRPGLSTADRPATGAR